LGELANYRLDSKRARQRLEAARSALAETRFELARVEEALRLEEVIEFPAPSITIVPIEPIIEVSPETKKKNLG
jgi:hypothetical protein